MVLTVFRALFILLMAAVGWSTLKQQSQPFADFTWLSMAGAVSIAVFLVCVDILAPRRKLVIFSGVFFGLIVGLAFSYALSFLVTLVTDRYLPTPDPSDTNRYANWKSIHDATIGYIDLTLGISCCYLAISFVLQTKDDIRFIIPYVEFSKQTKGARPIIVDTSVLIDGRINDIAATGIIESRLIVPRFVLDELHLIADSGDKHNRARGRLGLDALNKLQTDEPIEVTLYESNGKTVDANVDQQLVDLAKSLNGRILTNDYNLNKVAKFRGVSVINLNELSNALKSVLTAGETVSVKIQKAGDQAGQGVGYLADGTMVVVEQGRPHVGSDVTVQVSNIRQTAAGRMIFGRLAEG